MKKILSIFVVLMLLASMAAGCATASPSTAPTQAPTDAQTQAPTDAPTDAPTEPSTKLSETPVTLSLAMPENPVAGTSYANNLPVFQELEKRTNVKIDWQVINGADYDATMKTRIASATDLPDIYQLPGGVEIMQLVKGSLALPVKDLIAQYGPNIAKLYEENPDIKAVMIAPDGNMYCVPDRVMPMTAFELNPQTFIIRSDWLKAVGASNPVTMADWYNVLTLFKTKDPSGDGQTNEIPYSGTISMVYAFMHAYGLCSASSFYPDASGKVQYQWTQPAMKDYLTEMNKWYKEGLIDPQILSISDDLMWGQMLDNLVGATYLTAASNCNWLDQNNTKVKTADWLAVAPPKNVSTGQDSFLMSSDRSGGKVVISASCKSPDVAVKWVNYLLSDEGSTLTCMGIEGQTFTKSADGTLAYTDAILKPDGKWYENQKKFGIDPAGVPQLIRSEWYAAIFASYNPSIMDSVKPMINYIKPPFPAVIATDEENAVLSSKMADIDTYTNEMITKMIVGNEPLTSFDTYVSKVGELGIDTIVAIKQAQYDRTK